jgi:hypothetical protein
MDLRSSIYLIIIFIEEIFLFANITAGMRRTMNRSKIVAEGNSGIMPSK